MFDSILIHIPAFFRNHWEWFAIGAACLVAAGCISRMVRTRMIGLAISLVLGAVVLAAINAYKAERQPGHQLLVTPDSGGLLAQGLKTVSLSASSSSGSSPPNTVAGHQSSWERFNAARQEIHATPPEPPQPETQVVREGEGPDPGTQRGMTPVTTAERPHPQPAFVQP